jgi:hypothetical protein
VAKLISQRKLTSIKREWQKLLRLQDWKIKIRFATDEELEEATGVEAVGACHSSPETREAQILIADVSVLEEGDRQRDVENTIVHELLHVHFAPFQSDHEAVKLQHEQAIEPITDALLKLKRKNVTGSRTNKAGRS